MAIINNSVNDIAITVLDNAVLDPSTGLPTPTVFVGTEGGLSTITNAGTVVNSTSTVSVTKVAADGKKLTTVRSDGVVSVWDNVTTMAVAPNTTYTASSIPALLGTVSGVTVGKAKYLGSSAGLTVLYDNPVDPTKGMAARITNASNSGLQLGDSRGAWLTDTVAETITASGELVTNPGPFTVTTGYAINGTGTLSINAARLKVDSLASWSDGILYTLPDLTFATPKRVTITIDIGSSSLVQINLGNGTYGNAAAGLLNITASGTYSIDNAIAPGSPGISIKSSSASTFYVSAVSVKLAEPDRSVKNNGLIINGSLTKSAVASGANLMAYSGFSAANYLEQPYSANHDYSTTGFSGHFWLKEAPNSAIEYLVNRDSATPAQAIRLWVSVVGFLVFELYDGTTTRTATGTVAIDDSTWKCVAFTYLAGTLNVYVNGVLYATATGAALLTLNNAAAVLRVGLNVAGSYPATNASLSLVRLSATVASADQIAHIYRTELPLFQANAKCTIDGTSIVVTALAYDEATDLLQVGTPWGRTSFKDLVRVDSEATTTGALTSLSANQGAILTGGTSAKYYQPAMLLRDELRRKEEARKALGKVPVFIEFDAVTSQVAFVLPKGYICKAVYSAGTLKRVGATKDYSVSTDGFSETVTFAVAPGNGIWVSIMGVRA